MREQPSRRAPKETQVTYWTRFRSSRHAGALLIVVALGVTALVGTPRILAVDCDSDGVEDAAAIVAGTVTDCNGNGIPDACDDVPIELALGQVTLPVSATPRLLATTDWEGDGDRDLVQVSRTGSSSTVVLVENTGARTFATHATQVDPLIYSIAIADMNGDGLQDLVTANDATVAILRQTPEGEVAPPVLHDVGLRTRLVVAADFTGDGAMDLAVPERRALRIGILPGDGGGELAAPVMSPGSDDPLALAVADFNHDGNLDLASADRGTETFSIFKGNGAGGLTLSAQYPLLDFPLSLNAADVTADGAPDLVATTSNWIVVLLNRGDGTFAEPVRYSTPLARVADLGDVDGDGDLDIATVLRPETLLVRRNDGQGRFSVANVWSGLLTEPMSVAAGDYDGDGFLDLGIMTANPSTVQFFWNGEPGAGLVLRNETIALTNCAGQACRPHAGAMADVDGDGDLDIIAGIPWPASLSVGINEGGRFVMLPNRSYGGGQSRSADTGDLNSDGIVDLVTIDNNDAVLRAHRGVGDGTFVVEQTVPVGAGPIRVRLADFDGDDDLDAAAASPGSGTVTVLFQEGDFRFVSKPDQPELRFTRPRSMVGFDGDGDGDNDLAVGHAGATNVSVFTNPGDGVFDADVVSQPLTSAANAIRAADVDGDGAPDLVVAITNAAVAVLVNRGDGTFRDSQDYSTGWIPDTMVLVDFDGDGILDIITGSETDSNVSILLGRGDGSFEKPRTFPAGDGLRFVFGGDLDDDGDADLVTLDRGAQTITTLYNESVGVPLAPPFAELLCTLSEFHESSAAVDGSPGERRLSFLVREDATTPLPAVVFVSPERFPDISAFLRETFATTYGTLGQEDYLASIDTRTTRRFFVGEISQRQSTQGHRYSFDVFARWSDASERLTQLEVEGIHARLAAGFPVAPLTFAPRSLEAQATAISWSDPSFPVEIPPSARPRNDFQAYTLGVALGRVRCLTAAELGGAAANCQLEPRDIVVVPMAVAALNGAVAGVLTGTPQSELSELTTRTARDGIPNAYDATATTRLAELDGMWVRLEILRDEWTVSPISPPALPRRAVPSVPPVDYELRSVSTFDDLVTLRAGGAERELFGSLGAAAVSLAILRGTFTGALTPHRPEGVVVPASRYREFLRGNRIASFVEPDREVTYEEYLAEVSSLTGEEESPQRCDALARLRRGIREDASITGDLEAEIAAALTEVFDDPGVPLLVTPSLNVHGAPEFSRAFLYATTRIEPQPTYGKALREAWADVFSIAATATRELWAVPAGPLGVGVVLQRAPTEPRLRGIAVLTGAEPSARHRLWAQRGNVDPRDSAGVVELIVLSLEQEAPSNVERITASCRMPPGLPLLSNERLASLAPLLSRARTSFLPLTATEAAGRKRLEVSFHLDREEVFRLDGAEEFIDTTPTSTSPLFEVEIPEGTVICGTFAEADTTRGLREEYELKSSVILLPGVVSLPTDADSFPADLIEEVRFGPRRERATPTARGGFELLTFTAPDGGSVYRFTYRQPFRLRDGRALVIEIAAPLTFTAADSGEATGRRQLDEEYFTTQPGLEPVRALLNGEPVVHYGSCTHQLLPRFEIDATLEDGSRLRLTERFLEAASLNETGPASLERAEITVGATSRSISEYWNLVYSAGRHNLGVGYWLVLEPAVPIPGLDEAVRVVELIPAEPELGVMVPSAAYLGEDFQQLRGLAVPTITRSAATEPVFLRGDANADGRLNLVDALSVLGFLFGREAPPACDKAADANDDGRLNVTDAVVLLRALIGEHEPLPAPGSDCGTDPTVDALTCRELCGS